MSLADDVDRIAVLYAKIDLIDDMARRRWRNYWRNIFKAIFRRKRKKLKPIPAPVDPRLRKGCKHGHGPEARYLKQFNATATHRAYVTATCRECERETSRRMRQRIKERKAAKTPNADQQ